MTIVINDFKSGWQNAAQHEDMKSDALFMCEDFSIDETGALKCRELMTEQSYFATQSLTSPARNIYFVDVEGTNAYLIFYTVGTNLYCYNSVTKTTRTLSTSMVNGGYVSYAPLKPQLASRTRVYLTDGVTMLADDGISSTTWGIDPPSGNIKGTANGSGGLLSAGDYYWTYTFYDGLTGSESDPAPYSPTITCGANDSVALTNIEVSSDSRVTARKVYRTRSDGGTCYLVTTITDNVATTYTDGVSDDDITLELETDQGIPPLVGVIRPYKGYVFMAGDVSYPKRLYFTKRFLPDNVPSTYWTEAAFDIVDLFEFEGALYAHTTHGAERLHGDNPDNFYLDETRSHVGVQTQRSGARGQDGRYFYSNGGVYRFDGLKSVSVSEPIERTFRKTAETWTDIVDEDTVDVEAVGSSLEERYYLVLPMKDTSGTVVNKLLEYDTARPEGKQTWIVHDLDLYDIFVDRKRKKLYGSLADASNSGYYTVYELLSVDSGSADSPSPQCVTKAFSVVQPKSYAFSGAGLVPTAEKAIDWIRKYRIDGLGSWTLTFYLDGRNVHSETVSSLTEANKYLWRGFASKLKGRHLYIHIQAYGTALPSTHKIKEIEVR